jgi:pilus assembly protein Flp/PilA
VKFLPHPLRASARNNDRGAALVEYGLLVGLVAVIAIGSVSALGSSVDRTFSDVAHSLSGAMPTSDAGVQKEAGVEEETGAVLPTWSITAGRAQDWTGYTNPSYNNSFGTLHSNTGATIRSMYDYRDDQLMIRMAGDLREALAGTDLICNGTTVASVSEATVNYLNTDNTDVRWIAPGPGRLLVNGQSYDCEFS